MQVIIENPNISLEYWREKKLGEKWTRSKQAGTYRKPVPTKMDEFLEILQPTVLICNVILMFADSW